MIKREWEHKIKTILEATIKMKEINIIIVIEIIIMKKDLKITTKIKIIIKALKDHNFQLDHLNLLFLFQ